MCEQTPVDYKNGDIVWVKLGSCWWPGEVQELENLPKEWLADFKKPPITAVKFFDEDKYEYVKSIDKIYSYNCTKKTEFIKKGLDLLRAKHSFMEKFPSDITTAERKTNGDPNILSGSMFTPEKRTNFAATLFESSPKSKKRKLSTTNRRSKNLSMGPVELSSSNTRVTHPRFVGHDDHEVRILVQTHDKEASTLQEEPMYNCRSCGFKTSRIDVIVLHNKSHIQGTYSTPTSCSRKSKKPTRGKKIVKMIRSKTSSIMEDLAMIDKGLSLNLKSSDEDSIEEWNELTPKRKRRKTKTKIKKIQIKKESNVKVDIRNNLLAEWEDESETEDTDLNTSSNTTVPSEITLNETQLMLENKSDSNIMQMDKSCFDFEEENEDNKIVDAPSGRKIPRVIPHSNKQKTTDLEPQKLVSLETPNYDSEILNIDEKDDCNYQYPNDEAFQDILNTTTVPELPESSDLLKCEQNFHDVKTIKFPDKIESNDDSKTICFENKSEGDTNQVDFLESSVPNIVTDNKGINKNLQFWEDIVKDLPDTQKGRDYRDQLTKLEDDLKEKHTVDNAYRPNIEELTEALCKQDVEVEIAPMSEANKIALVNQNVTNLNEKHIPETSNETIIKCSSTELSEVKPKIINPKKRFVKSFEDFEQQLNSENKNQVENKDSLDSEQNKSYVEVSKLKTQLKHKLEGCEKLSQNKSNLHELNYDSGFSKLSVEAVSTINKKCATLPISDEIAEYKISPIQSKSLESEETNALQNQFNSTKTKSEGIQISHANDEQNVIQHEETISNSNKTFEEGNRDQESNKKFYNVNVPELLIENDTKIEQFCNDTNKATEDLSALSTLAELSTNLDLQSSIADNKLEILNEFPKNNDEKNSILTSSSFGLESTIDVRSDNISEVHKEEIVDTKSRPFKLGTYDTSIQVTKIDPKHGLQKNNEFVGSDKLQSLSNNKIDTKTLVVKHRDSVKFNSTIDNKNPKYIATPKKSVPPVSKLSKPIILSEKVIKPVSENETVSVKKVSSKRISQNDYEDMDAFIIQKAKCSTFSENSVSSNSSPSYSIQNHPSVPRGKAKILQQTIIKPTGDIVKPDCHKMKHSCPDDNVFDINSMPIVLDDQILSTECIESMPIVLSDSLQPISNKSVYSSVTPVKTPSKQVKLLNNMSSQPMVMKTYSSPKLIKNSKVFQSFSKGIKSAPTGIITKSKPEKFIIVSSVNSTSTTSKYTVGKRPLTKKTPIVPNTISTSSRTPLNSEPTGNKIMIVTNQQGQQSRVLLTPSQQKLLGYQTAKTKLVRSTLKNNILLKSTNTKSTSSTLISSTAASNTLSNAFINCDTEKSSTASVSLATTLNQIPQQAQLPKLDVIKLEKKIELPIKKMKFQEGLTTLRGQQKTIVIKNQQGQIVKKIQGTDDALLEQQVAEQVQAIKASGGFSLPKPKQDIKTTIKRAYPKKVYHSPLQSKLQPQTTIASSQQFETSLPPLTPISTKISEKMKNLPKTEEIKIDSLKIVNKQEISQKPLNQLIIQDASGNQTTITEGQILALPSGDTVDGQPQSYMLVTLDESGNLAPLNNEALLSLDPNLCLGGDLSNVVLQIDNETNSNNQEAIENVASAITTTNESSRDPAFNLENQIESEDAPMSKITQLKPQVLNISTPVSEYNKNSTIVTATESVEPPQSVSSSLQTVARNMTNESNRQLIITGDPESTQKFIESLTEGNQDLANLLATAEGNIIIQTDEQQILINTKLEEKENSSVYSSSSNQNQDILAAALADTDVFQLEHKSRSKIVQPSPISPSGLYPTNVNNLLETTLSLSSPIMTPLEIPSSNNKKILDLETDVLNTEITKNVDLPITITDPNISQTVSQQQHVASLLMNELANNLELPLTIADQAESTEISSSSYIYSLPTLEESVNSCSKIFVGAISMPLLNEDSSISMNIDNTLEATTLESCTVEDSQTQFNEEFIVGSVLPKQVATQNKEVYKDDAFLETRRTDKGLCTLGGEMCSSLSEPPPDTFDLAEEVSCSKECDVENIENNYSSHEINIESIYEMETDLVGKQDMNIAKLENDLNTLANCPSTSESLTNMDDNSCEIPVQPQIITDLCSSLETSSENVSSNNEITLSDSIENDAKKLKLN